MRRHRTLAVVPILLGIVVTLMPADRPAAAEAKNYAYLFLQGKISDPLDKSPLVGARVRLDGAPGVFTAETDRKGVFEFERLPVAHYDLEITTRDGRVMRGVKWIDPDDPERIRLQIHLDEGEADRIRVKPGREQIAVDIPEPRTRWKKLWIELGIFVAAAGLLAL